MHTTAIFYTRIIATREVCELKKPTAFIHIDLRRASARDAKSKRLNMCALKTQVKSTYAPDRL